MSHLPVPVRLQRIVAVLLVTAALVPLVAPVPPAGADPPIDYVPPVDAPVHDPFRAPAGPFAAGNRGIEYDTAPGTPVVAPAAGTVTFAGWVAGSRHVTILHPDGVRTTASYLDEVAVVVGQHVDQRDPLGSTTGRLHFGARRGDAYFDPATLFAAGPVPVRLVPFDHPPGLGPGGERSAVSQLLGLGASVLGLGVDAVGTALDGADAAAGWMRARAGEGLALAWHYGPHLVAPEVQLGLVLLSGVDAVAAAWNRSRRECTPDDRAVEPPPGRRIGLLVAGFGSSSGPTAIDDLDVDALGYEPADVVRFSYAGGRIPDADVRLPSVPVAAYGADDAGQDLWESAARLADLVEDLAAAAPGVPVDLLAHSQGGVVARLALLELVARHGPAWVERVGLLATIGTPHQGADLATAGVAAGSTATGSLLLAGLEAAGAARTSAPSMAQLAETSGVIAELRRAGLPAGLPAVSVSARGDLVVPAPRTDLPGAREATVPLTGPSAHRDLPGDDRTTREVALALSGAPPRCVGFGTALADELTGRAIGAAEDGLGAALWAAGHLADVRLGPAADAAALAAEEARR